MFFVSPRFIKRGSLGSGVSILSRTVELVQQPAKPLMGGRGRGGHKATRTKTKQTNNTWNDDRRLSRFYVCPWFFLENSFGVTEWWNIDFECFHSFFFLFCFYNKAHGDITLSYNIIMLSEDKILKREK